MQWKVKMGYSLHLAENRKTKNNINFHKILSFLCQECCPLKSFLSFLLSPSVYLHSYHTMPPSSKSSQSLSANATLNQNQKWKKRSNSIVTTGCHCLSSSRTNCQKVTVTSPCSKAQKKES